MPNLAPIDIQPVEEKPLGAQEAVKRVEYFRKELGCQHCEYRQRLFDQVAGMLGEEGFPASRTFDVVLAITLRDNEVDTFYTRNSRDFQELGWFELIDPIAAR